MAIPSYATLCAVKMQKSLFQLRRKGEKKGGDRQLTEGTEEEVKRREGGEKKQKRVGEEWKQKSLRGVQRHSRAAGMAAGESISFHLIAELGNYIVSCHGLF